jgi:hypothetical protein
MRVQIGFHFNGGVAMATKHYDAAQEYGDAFEHLVVFDPGKHDDDIRCELYIRGVDPTVLSDAVDAFNRIIELGAKHGPSAEAISEEEADAV